MADRLARPDRRRGGPGAGRHARHPPVRARRRAAQGQHPAGTDGTPRRRPSPGHRPDPGLGGATTTADAASSFALVDGVLDDFIITLFSGIDQEKLVTRWGADPVWGSALPTRRSVHPSFPLRVAVGTGLSLAETTKAPVTVVEHRPEYDQCASCGSATCRSTPARRTSRSCARRCAATSQLDPRSAHLAVVLAGYAQLVADRTASLTRSGMARRPCRCAGRRATATPPCSWAPTRGVPEGDQETGRFVYPGDRFAWSPRRSSATLRPPTALARWSVEPGRHASLRVRDL